MMNGGHGEIHVCMSVCVCVCVSVYVRERD